MLEKIDIHGTTVYSFKIIKLHENSSGLEYLVTSSPNWVH